MLNLQGQKFNRLTAVKPTNKRKWRSIVWWCQCECGNLIQIPARHLTCGDTNSCGCLRKEVTIKRNLKRITHGQSYSRLYHIWNSIKNRCKGQTNRSKYYSEKGVKICNDWLGSFESFQSWALSNGYKDNLTIDRIDNDGNYELSNCQWITREENSRKAGSIKKGK